MWALIVSVPDHCLSFYFKTNQATSLLQCVNAVGISVWPIFVTFILKHILIRYKYSSEYILHVP